ncbi:hypothetical protein [Immundisolibacter sp.]|uniref:hypothetical protein n=1 Tax=Immundisolibacter sp. TaxID=1934948 RepID=UPI00356AC9CC
MADKREILNYLRNRQKAAEIEAKVNGINLWVLLGAIAFVIWQLIPSLQTDIGAHKDLILRVLLCTEAIYLTSLFMSPTTGISEEVRFTSQPSHDTGSALLRIVTGAFLLFPPALFSLVIGKSFSALLTGLFGLAFLGFGIFSIAKQLANNEPEVARLPKPHFNPTRRSDVIVTIVTGLLFLLAITEQLSAISMQIGSADTNILKALALIASLYILVLISIRRLLRNQSLLWTYELETDLLLESISPEIALRRIEHRALGPRLRDVMDRYFDDLDKIFSELDVLTTECKAKLAEIPDIPSRYAAERAARIDTAISGPKSRIDAILQECRELSKYLDKLDDQQPGRRRPAVIALLPSLRNRHKDYEERAKKARSELEAMTRVASSVQKSE